MKRAWLLLAGLCAGSVLAQACDAVPPGATRLESPRFVLVYRTEPAIALNRHFAVAVTLCPKAPLPDRIRLRVDAEMPAHRHGMNYRPGMSEPGAGQYRAEGLIFHMPGQWDLLFEIDAGGRIDRVRQSVNLQ